MSGTSTANASFRTVIFRFVALVVYPPMAFMMRVGGLMNDPLSTSWTA